MAKRRLPDLADDHRCTRNGTNWRCHLPRLPGKSYCQKHHLFNLARSHARSKSKSLAPNPNPNPNPNLLREIWAFHPTPGAPPRLYARVERRVPNQSLVEVTPLIPYPNDGVDVSCGLFRALETTEMKDMGTFSHRVWFEMGAVDGGEELYKIFPRKGEVWAVERYNWVEMVSSFGDGEGASGLVLEEEEEEEDEGGFRRRLYEGCELIRRFSMEEMGMFLYRISEARVIGVGNLLASQGCMSLTEGENGTSLQGQVTICHPPEEENITEKPTEEQASDTLLKEGQVIEELAPGSIDNGGEYAQTSRGVSIQSADGYEMTLRSTENYRQPEIWSFSSQGVSKARPVDYEAASVL